MTITTSVHLDFETYCDLDLKKVGIYRYVRDPSFKVLCAAWTENGHPRTHMSANRRELPQRLTNLLHDPTVRIHAWNSAFETAVIEALGYGGSTLNPISCTMQRALSYGLPPKLEAAGAALGLKIQKDMAGSRLMMKMSRPLKEGMEPWTLEDYQRLTDYCLQDVKAEEAISQVIPELSPDEKELSLLDLKMNTRGDLRVDLERVMTLRTVAEAAEDADAARCAFLTANAVTSPGTQTFRLIDWLLSQGIRMQDLSRDSVQEALGRALSDPIYPDAIEVLQIRLRAARASTKKLERMMEMELDGSLKGQFQFLGAGRTGRWSGRGVQVQNLPRVPSGFDPDEFHRMALAANGHATLDVVAPAPVLDCVSWSLRSCLMGSGPTWSIDFSQIEARVLAWLADQRDVIEVFRSGADVYIWAAQQFGSNNRQLGKVLILALGYGMGAIKLRDTARKNYGVEMTAAEAERFKTEWRRQNYMIVRFWAEIETAAKKAVLSQGTVCTVSTAGIAFVCTPRTLQMRLPSGRVLYYHRPYLEAGTGTLLYWGTGIGGKWEEQRTWGGKLAENATQATARDIMAEAMLRVWRRSGDVPIMTVHDELVYIVEGPTLRETILEAPSWAGGLPIAGEDKMLSRYSVLSNQQ